MKIKYHLFFLLITSLTISQNNEDIIIKPKYTNSLINETSPYLLQHAHNPINWYPWGMEALNKAKLENKLIIISIGYSSCHWCHVMEEESFNNLEVAKIMNDNFIAIKVDREERPDIDQVYMTAVQLLTGRGGWPLNCIALPDGRPIYGGTYFPKDQWINMLNRIHEFVKVTPEKALHQADLISQGIESNLIQFSDTKSPNFTRNSIDTVFNRIISTIDFKNGGFNQSPKFPLPNSFEFLLNYSYLYQNEDALNAVLLTLDKISDGGIYDHIGGGFARYSTDEYWKVPHFEKMLYDNAQLISLFSNAYRHTKNPNYKNIVMETLDFIENEMTSKEGGFYSSIDADSDGEEGNYYVWYYKEIEKVLNEYSEIFIEYYNISELGNWEKSKNILYKSGNEYDIQKKYGIDEKQLKDIITDSKHALNKIRNKRIRPAIDTKIITSWNALMLTAYIEAFNTFGDVKFLNNAIKNGEFILSNMWSADGNLFRIYNNKSSINAFLDDYAFTIKAFTSLYQATFEEKWLHSAKKLAEYSIEHFFDNNNGMFYFTSDIDEKLFIKKMEIQDSVIPSSNSQMALNLFTLGHYYYNDEYINISKRMFNNVKDNSLSGSSEYSNWNILLSWLTNGIYEVAIVGNNYKKFLREINLQYLPNVFLSGGSSEGTLSLLEDKLISGQTTIYVCKDKACRLPVTKVTEALEQIK